MSKKSLLITGGLGNLGSWILESALDNFDVTVLSRKLRKLNINKKYNLLIADLADPESLSKSLKNKKFDYVIHAGSVNDGFIEGYQDLSYKVNSFGTLNLLNALKLENLKHFIYLSTFQVYGAYKGLINEDTVPSPKNDYGLSHLLAEYFLSIHMPKSSFSIIRLTNSYGCPKDLDSSKWYLVLNDLSRQAFMNRTIQLTGNGKAIRDFIWMGDVVEAILELIALKPEDDIYNISQGRITSMQEVAEIVQKAYKEYSGESIPIKTNEDDNSLPDTTLKVTSRKIKKRINLSSNDRMKEEAIKIFRFLED